MILLIRTVSGAEHKVYAEDRLDVTSVINQVANGTGMIYALSGAEVAARNVESVTVDTES